MHPFVTPIRSIAAWLLLSAAVMAQSPASANTNMSGLAPLPIQVQTPGPTKDQAVAIQITSPEGSNEQTTAAPSVAPQTVAPQIVNERSDSLSNTLPEGSPEGKNEAGTTSTPRAASAPAQVITLPAGTKVLMALSSPLHTTSAVEGSGLYLETVFPVVQENRIVIPARTQVLGVVESERRPGRVQGRAQFKFHFTSLVFANNYVTAIDGALQSVPGNSKVRTQNAQGTIEPVDQIDRDIVTLAEGVGEGFVAGSIHGGRIGATEQSAIGAGAGAALALGKVLFTRGDEIRLDYGSFVEMVLTRPVSIEVEHIPSNAESLAQPRYAMAGMNRGQGFSTNNNSSASRAHNSHLGVLRWLWLLTLLR